VATIQFKAGVRTPRALDLVSYNALLALLVAWLWAGRPLLTVTDWGRTPEENARVGGVGGLACGSRHCIFAAFDVRRDQAGFAVAARWRDLGGEVIDEGDHLHLE
jgi:hypothetical protein